MHVLCRGDLKTDATHLAWQVITSLNSMMILKLYQRHIISLTQRDEDHYPSQYAVPLSKLTSPLPDIVEEERRGRG